MRKYFRGSSTKTNNEKVELDELLEAFNARNIVKTVENMNILGLSQTKHSLNWALRSDIWSLSLKFEKFEIEETWNWRSLKEYETWS